jgi:hypothetical protein
MSGSAKSADHSAGLPEMVSRNCGTGLAFSEAETLKYEYDFTDRKPFPPGRNCLLDKKMGNFSESVAPGY